MIQHYARAAWEYIDAALLWLAFEPAGRYLNWRREKMSRKCPECGQVIKVRGDGKFVMHTYPGLPVECQGSEEKA